MDSFGRVIEAQAPDQWKARSGLAVLLSHLAPLLSNDNVRPLVAFYVPDALRDRNADVALMMQKSAVELIEYHGKVRNHLSVCTQHLLHLYSIYAPSLLHIYSISAPSLLNIYSICVHKLLGLYSSCTESLTGLASAHFMLSIFFDKECL